MSCQELFDTIKKSIAAQGFYRYYDSYSGDWPWRSVYLHEHCKGFIKEEAKKHDYKVRWEHGSFVSWSDPNWPDEDDDLVMCVSDMAWTDDCRNYTIDIEISK
jgi:hypothetical protein